MVHEAATEYALIIAASQIFVAWESFTEGVLGGAGDTKSIHSLLQKINSGIGILGTVTDYKPQVVIVVTKDLIKNGIFAGNIAKEVGKTMGGGGGGKPHLATSGGQNSDKLNSAIYSGKVMAKSLILNETNGS